MQRKRRCSRSLPLKCLLALLHAGMTSTQSSGMDQSSCFVGQPVELAVMYSTDASFALELTKKGSGERSSRGQRTPFSIALNGEVVVNEIGCPAEFKMKGLSPGMYTLSLTELATGASTLRIFYVAHEMFWEGKRLSPLPHSVDNEEETKTCHKSVRSRGDGTVHFWVLMAAWNSGVASSQSSYTSTRRVRVLM
eukprot:199350-Rhodomonas_salina.2